MARDAIVLQILDERERQFHLPGREFDVRNSPNDWIAIAASYVLRPVTMKHSKPKLSDFHDDLIKAAAVIVAALEHIELMKEHAQFS